MIVDDKHMIIGSANINDRSMNGTRDSELAVCIKDQQKVAIQCDQKDFNAYQFAHDFRTTFFIEHLGLIFLG